MTDWGEFAKQMRRGGDDLTPHPTMSLRAICDTRKNIIAIEQLVEYKNAQSQVVDTAWIEIPTILINED